MFLTQLNLNSYSQKKVAGVSYYVERTLKTLELRRKGSCRQAVWDTKVTVYNIEMQRAIVSARMKYAVQQAENKRKYQAAPNFFSCPP